jgi:thiamine-monophosphate kinase
VDPLAWVLGGGHDHALVGAFAADQSLPEGFVRIGSVRERATTTAGDDADSAEAASPWVTVDGSPWRGASGHVHFS